MFAREFRRYVGEVSRSTIEANYTSDDSLIKKIRVLKKDQSPGEHRLRDTLYIECVNTPEGRALADCIATATETVKVWEGSSMEEKALRRNWNYQLYTKYTNVDQLKRLINILHSTLHNGVPIIDEQTRNLLLADTDIRVYCEEIHADILAQADIDPARGKELAVEYDREYGYYKILWTLAEHFKKKNLLDDAAEMYTAIPSNNRHYFAESRLQLKSLYQGQLTANQLGAITLTPEQIQVIREKLLELSLLGGDHGFSTCMFYDLSGFGLIQHPHQIKLNSTPETLIHLARQMAELNKENKRLQAELAQFKQGSQSAAAINLGDQSATSSTSAQLGSVFLSPPSQAAAVPMSLYAPSSSAMYRQPASGSLDSDDDIDMAQQQNLGNSSVRNANS